MTDYSSYARLTERVVRESYIRQHKRIHDTWLAQMGAQFCPVCGYGAIPEDESACAMCKPTEKAKEIKMDNQEKNMDAFRGSLFVASVVSTATALITYAVFDNIILAAGITGMVFIIALIYLFGAAIGEW